MKLKIINYTNIVVQQVLKMMTIYFLILLILKADKAVVLST